MPSLREILVELAILVGIAIVLAALGPFGSFSIGSFAVRLAYWLPATFIGYGFFRPLTAISARLAERLHFHSFVALAAGIVVAALPATIAMGFLGGVRPGHWPSLDGWFDLYSNVVIVGSVIALFFTLLGQGAAPDERGESLAQSASSAPFLDRLPPAWNGQLVALEMEDHYVRAHGRDGASTLILMRMADAARELDGANGTRVHRSWWVMRNCVIGKRREGRGLRLELVGGLTAPVARDRVAPLKADGWPL